MPAALAHGALLLLLSATASQEPAPTPPEEERPADETPPPPAEEQEPVGEAAQEEAQLPPGEEPPVPGSEVPAVEADWLAAWNEELARRAANDFELCDLDGNGWIAFREAAQALELEREEFRRHDTDQDGRLDPEEFEARFRLLMERVGRVGPPRIGLPDTFPSGEATEAEAEAAAVALTPLDVLRRFDADASRGLGLTEVARVFDDFEVELDPALLMQQMDADTTAQLEIEELAPLTALVSRRLADRAEGVDTGSPWAGRALPRRPFERLDTNGDGRCSADELRDLVAPARLDVRAAAIVAALDRDGNGAIDQSEFQASMER